ncbi:MAG TPA: TonB-dependent receptor [Verrucomicrobiae bacterium]|jgi:vitamin B12 transporter|nr:TonB-dependent receptor [Verrucomicrobiae bacterium]
MHRYAVLRALCVAALTVSSTLVARADAAPTPTPAPSSAPQIAHVVTSDRADETPTSAARTTYVVTKAEMLGHGYRTIADAIATLPGVNLVRYGPGAAAASVGIRGSSSSQVLVLIDGAPAAGAQLDSVDLAAIPTSGVERIEVVEGGGSTLYGSGSIGGIINIITTPLKETVVDARSGSFGQRDLRIQTSNVSFARSVGTDNFRLPDGSTLANADYNVTAGRVSLDRSLGSIRATFSAGITQRHQGDNGGDAFFSATTRQDDVTRDAHAVLNYASGNATTTLQLDGTSLALELTCDSPVDASCLNSYLPSPSPFAQLLTEGRVQASLRTVIDNPRGTTIAGIDLARGVARVDDGTDPLEIHPFDQTAAYIQQRWSLARGNLVYAGIRGERDGAPGGAFSPSLGGVFNLAAHTHVRINAATAFRAPTADDLYYPFFSNPLLVPERTRVGDVTLDNDAILGGVALGWFSTTGTNLIVDDGSYVPHNVGHASIAGLTFTAKTRPLHGITSSLEITNLYRAQDLDSDPTTDVYAGQRLPGRGPVFQANLELAYAGVGAVQSVGIDDRSVGARGAVNPMLSTFDQPTGYSRIDAFARLRVGERALLTLRGFNLGDERYAEISGGYPMPGRWFALELSSR